MLELRQLRYFIAVAESEHVARAAETLNISQSPLSRQIMQLEAQLGVDLFERNRKRLRLTADGREFLGEARELVAHAGRLEDRGRSLGRGAAGGMTIGYVEGAVHSGLIGKILGRFKLARPERQFRLANQRSFEQIDGLRSAVLDAGLLYTPPSPDDPDLATALVLDEPLVLALPVDDPLASSSQVTPSDVDGRVWITVVRQPNDTNRDRFVAACARAGFIPNIVYETADPLTSLGLVAAGLGLAVVQASLQQAAPRGVAFRALPWFDRRVSVYLAWRRSDRRAVVAAFVAAAIRDDKDGR
jgi:DNA-binding transcriptional LysR family regulator